MQISVDRLYNRAALLLSIYKLKITEAISLEIQLEESNQKPYAKV